jgi:hypothetical protein
MARVGEAEAALARRDHQTAGTRSVNGMSERSVKDSVLLWRRVSASGIAEVVGGSAGHVGLPRFA